MRQIQIDQDPVDEAQKRAYALASDIVNTLLGAGACAMVVEVTLTRSELPFASGMAPRMVPLVIQRRTDGVRAACALSTGFPAASGMPLPHVVLRQLMRDRCSSHFKLLEGSQHNWSDWRQRNYRLFNAEGRSLAILTLWVDEGPPVTERDGKVSQRSMKVQMWPDSKSGESVSLLLQKTFSLLPSSDLDGGSKPAISHSLRVEHAWREFQRPPSAVGPYEQELTLPLEVEGVVDGVRRCLLLELPVQGATGRGDTPACFEFKVREAGVYMQTEKNPQSDELTFTLDFGALQMSVEDFVSLQPGSVIRIPNALVSSGILRFGGEPVATVELRVEGTELHLRTSDFFRLPNPEYRLDVSSDRCQRQELGRRHVGHRKLSPGNTDKEELAREAPV